MLILMFAVMFLSLAFYYYVSLRLTSEKGVLSIQVSYMLFSFAIAPLLHLYYRYLPQDLYFFDFEGSFGYLTLINTLGVFIAIFGYLLSSRVKYNSKFNCGFFLSSNFNRVLVLYIFFASVYLFYMMMTSSVFYVESKRDELVNANLISYMIIESVPILFAWLICLTLRSKKKSYFYRAISLFFIVSVLFGGMRGSRVSIVFNLLAFMLLYSYMVRSIRLKDILFILIFMFAFNTVYSNYKYSGINGVKTYLLSGEKSNYIKGKDNEFLHFLLGDLARASIQAKIIDSINGNVFHPNYTPDTYISAFSLLLPKSFRSDNFETKRTLGTEAQYGFKSNQFYSSSRIYGMLGESMLNFGYWLFGGVFFLYGFLHCYFLRLIRHVKNSDYVLFVPLFFVFPVYFLFYDLDNIIFQVVKTWLIPGVIFFCFKFFSVRDK
ncbi:hypothetical protein AKN93_07050 [Thiopseudomonas alkaliphila]|uniref:hypothetical protein n=1 Tax=Thiopseudomonas alkaliphila TaxID=1697053 RepID=UPI00069E0523|nr:hypothetical protein [Thiopseudomonas alkaliphila]AKX49191.1 hypothetical protein AKN93_07050 [Thiopseudomonas alkaliphila]